MEVLAKSRVLDTVPGLTPVHDMRHRTYRGEIYGENGDTSMTVEIKVGPPVITIDPGNLFMVTDQRGEIDPDSEHGLFAEDTRFVSFYQIYLNTAPWQLLSSSGLKGA